jgi:DNA-binding Lrp family transcriptional regulator
MIRRPCVFLWVWQQGRTDISCRIPNIKACYHSSGRFDYLLHLVARDLNELGVLVKIRITSLPDFGRCETHLVFSEIETSNQWPFLDEKAMD